MNPSGLDRELGYIGDVTTTFGKLKQAGVSPSVPYALVIISDSKVSRKNSVEIRLIIQPWLGRARSEQVCLDHIRQRPFLPIARGVVDARPIRGLTWRSDRPSPQRKRNADNIVK
jgi:hypothetical protein